MKPLIIAFRIVWFVLFLLLAGTAGLMIYQVMNPGTYGIVVSLDVGEETLPFTLQYDLVDGEWVVRSSNGASDTIATTSAPRDAITGPSFHVRFPHFDSELVLDRRDGNHRMSGYWLKTRGDGTVARVTATAVSPADPGAPHFEPVAGAGSPAPFAGRWSVRFSSSDDLAIGVFKADENQLATGTFMTTTGDYRYLAGRVDGDLMRLSTFDGAHAFLFHARMQEDGTIEGDFWSGNWWHERWTAERNPDAQLPDMFEQTTVADARALDDLTFKALDGTPTRVTELLNASDAPARVLYVFGTWCPNCSDAAAELKRLKELHGDSLGVLGLAFELTDDHERSARQVERYRERFGSTWPILIAGLSDKAKASAELPILDKVRSYPTTIFLNRDNEIVSVHTGFTGPATGEAFNDQQRAFERIIGGLISQQP
ncbi:MAG: hypothetical protein AAGA55_04620 [Planctomycetota bacterium]